MDKEKSNAELLRCCECSFVSYDQHDFNEHLLGHYGPKKFNCDQCSFLCRTQEQFDKHVKLMHADFRKFRCTDCDYATNIYHQFRVHVNRLCMGNQDQNADDGYEEGRSTRRKEKYYRYRSKVRGYDSYHRRSRHYPSFAPYPTATVSSLNVGITIKPTHVCGECGYSADSEERLAGHRRVHDSYKPYECEKCSYTVFGKSEFNDHVKSHSDVCTYRCGDCDYATNHHDAFKLHLRRRKHFSATLPIADDSPVHEQNDLVTQFRCGDCDYAINHHDAFKLHLRKNKHFSAMLPIIDDSPVHEENDLDKSHPDACTYRCGDCDYATNHHDVFKMHLRRNKHFSEMLPIGDDSPVHQQNVHQPTEEKEIEIIEI